MSTKTEARQLLTNFLRKIAEEQTEMVSIRGEDIMVSKAEALARLVWKMALGFEETKIHSDGVKTVIHVPNRGMMGVLFDRIDGRAIPMSDAGKEKREIADKISDQGKARITEAGEING